MVELQDYEKEILYHGFKAGIISSLELSKKLGGRYSINGIDNYTRVLVSSFNIKVTSNNNYDFTDLDFQKFKDFNFDFKNYIYQKDIDNFEDISFNLETKLELQNKYDKIVLFLIFLMGSSIFVFPFLSKFDSFYRILTIFFYVLVVAMFFIFNRLHLKYSLKVKERLILLLISLIKELNQVSSKYTSDKKILELIKDLSVVFINKNLNGNHSFKTVSNYFNFKKSFYFYFRELSQKKRLNVEKYFFKIYQIYFLLDDEKFNLLISTLPHKKKESRILVFFKYLFKNKEFFLNFKNLALKYTLPIIITLFVILLFDLIMPYQIYLGLLSKEGSGIIVFIAVFSFIFTIVNSIFNSKQN